MYDKVAVVAVVEIVDEDVIVNVLILVDVSVDEVREVSEVNVGVVGLVMGLVVVAVVVDAVDVPVREVLVLTVVTLVAVTLVCDDVVVLVVDKTGHVETYLATASTIQTSPAPHAQC